MLYKCYKWALTSGTSKKPWRKRVPKMRLWNWWRLPGTIYLPVWCWRLGTIKPVMHHSACGPAAWKHRTKNISQTLQLSCKRTVPTMTLIRAKSHKGTAGTGGGCVVRVRPEAVGDDWSSSVVREVGFQKGGSLTAEEARSKSNQSSQITSS